MLCLFKVLIVSLIPTLTIITTAIKICKSFLPFILWYILVQYFVFYTREFALKLCSNCLASAIWFSKKLYSTSTWDQFFDYVWEK